MVPTRKRLTNVVSAANAMAVGLVAVRIVAVRQHLSVPSPRSVRGRHSD